VEVSGWPFVKTVGEELYFAPDCEGFFWLAGQGGFGLQTSPAIAAAVESLVAGTDWPVPDVQREELLPGRLLRQPA
jgi:D-arginine dehydrogenase